MSSTSEEPRSINPLDLIQEECMQPVGKKNGDVKIGNIQDTFQFLLRSVQKPRNKTSPSIHKIPSRIRKLNEQVFEPRHVSIGPLHRKNVNLHAFEEQKEIFLQDLLVNSGLPIEETLETCVQKMTDSIDRIKTCYGNEIEGYSDDDITRMMVMDGCFILEFIYKLFMFNFDDKMVSEPISMAFDLVLIENQIPFFVLQHIFECTSSRFIPLVSLRDLTIAGLVPILEVFDLIKIKKYEDPNETGHILGFIHECYMKPSVEAKNEGSSNQVENHILDFIHESCRPLCDAVKKVVEKYQSPNIGEDPDKNQWSKKDDIVIRMPSDMFYSTRMFYSAVELDRAGVNFKPHQPQDGKWWFPFQKKEEDGKWSMDIELKFPRCSWFRPWAKPSLRMPVMRIHNNTELVFRNLIAYEQVFTRWGIPHYVTSYAKAMDRIIDNHEDVAILVKSKVLINTIGSNEEAAKLINDMCKGISCMCSFYEEQWKGMEKYHNKFWPKNIAWLRSTYFSNPWNIIALLAGMLLFGFTVVQTYYTVNPV